MVQRPVLGLVLVLVLVRGQLEEDREGKAITVKKVRRKLAVPLGQCPEEKVGVQVYANPASCNSFYKCENGTATGEECENGLLFDPLLALTDAVHNYCVYTWRAECGARPADRRPEPSPGCEFQFGLFPRGGGCQTSYTKCDMGTPSQMQCEAENVNIPVSLGLAYRPATHSCDWPDLLTDLGCDPAERLGNFTCPLLQDLVGTYNERFSPFPRFALADPRIYLICVEGRPRLQSCGAHDQFDGDSLTCVRRPPQLFYYR